MTPNNKNIAVLYHAECPDGFGASFAAWKKFSEKAIYIPVFHHTDPPAEIYGKDVYLLDYSYSEEKINAILPKIKSLTIIDHHISNQSAVKLARKSVFDSNHSGAVLSWNYFFPNKKVPMFLRSIEDIDIWKFKLPYTRELSTIANFYDFDYKIWSKLIREIETKNGIKKYIAQGRLLLERQEKYVDELVSNAEEVEFEGYKCLSVNSPLYISFIGEALVKKVPPIGVIWSRRKNKVIVSLRSDGTVDVSKLAQKYGGGGHRAAAGFLWEGNNDFLKFLK